MEVRFAVLADSANVSQENKLNITGIFDRVSAAIFPAQHLGSSLIIVLEAHPSEVGQHDVAVHFVNEDGDLLMNADLKVQFGHPVDPLHPMRANLILPMPLIPLPNEGEYRFDILVNGRHEAEVALIAQAADRG